MWIKFTEFSVELSDLGEEHRNNLTTCKTKCKTRNTLHVHTLHWLTLTGYTVCSLHSNLLVTWVSIIILLTNNDITCNVNDKMIKLTLTNYYALFKNFSAAWQTYYCNPTGNQENELYGGRVGR